MKADATSLDRLHDLVLPPPVPWWPPAPGWQWAIALALVLACYFAFRFFIHWQRNRYRREALVEWRRQYALLADPRTRAQSVADLATLLKRTALSAFPRQQVAALTGAPWRAFLNQATATRRFDSTAASLPQRACYGEIDTSQLDEATARDAAALVRLWICDHRVKFINREKPC